MYYDYDFDQQFDLMWQQATSISVWQRSQQPEAQRTPTEYCPYAKNFKNWCQKHLLARARANPSERVINEALFYLQQQYRARYFAVDRFHRQTFDDFGDHLCLHAVWLQTGAQLDDLLLRISPPHLYHVEPPKIIEKEKVIERVIERPGHIYIGDAPLD